MRAQLKSLIAADMELGDQPESERDFAFGIEAVIGREGEEGGDLFSFTVCSSARIARQADAGPFFANNLIICERFNLVEVTELIARMCERTSASSWSDLATQIAKFSCWEFEDYEMPMRDS